MKNKILIVDDNPVILKQIFDIIGKSGSKYEIFRAFDGFTALTIARENSPDLIITDWDMPRMSGIELIEQLKKDDEFKNIPVIMCTGVMTNSSNLETALNTGAVDYIRKPIDEIELLARINSMLMLVKSFNESIEKDKVIHRQKAELLQLKLEQKNRELTTYALMLAKKENEIVDVLEKLKDIYQTSKEKKVGQIIRELITTLQNKNKQSNSWEEFKKHFQTVHTEFFTNLLAQFPELTQNDLKICAFIRLNMVTKDIAGITGLSPRSIEVSRYRIRKKLSLDTNENLYNFLLEF